MTGAVSGGQGGRAACLKCHGFGPEIFGTGGDVRRICDLFGLSVNAAMRYTIALEHPDLATDTSPGS